MYNKLFSKIIRSSVWLQPHTTRIVWLTLLATMDENGFCEFASVGNLAVTAIVTLDEAKDAIRLLESPDPESSDPDNEGRRVERVPGGWIVLNCKKYKDLVKRSDKQEATRVRVARFRSRLSVTPDVTPEKRNGNENVTTSEIEIEIETETETKKHTSEKASEVSEYCSDIFEQYPRKIARAPAIKAILKSLTRLLEKEKTDGYVDIHGAYEWLFLRTQAYAEERKGQDDKFTPHPATWFNQSRYLDEVKRG